MAEKADDKAPDVKTLEDALRVIRERDEQIQAERGKARDRGEENSDLRKKLRQAEEEKREIEERRRSDSQKTLEEQGRYKDLFETEQRRSSALQKERDEFEKKHLESKQERDAFAATIATYERREADRVEARFQKLPEETRKLHAASPTQVKDALADMFERLSGGRGSGSASPIPPSSLGPTGNFVREEDLEAMTQQERETFFKSADFKRAVSEGRFLRKGQPGPR